MLVIQLDIETDNTEQHSHLHLLRIIALLCRIFVAAEVHGKLCRDTSDQVSCPLSTVHCPLSTVDCPLSTALSIEQIVVIYRLQIFQYQVMASFIMLSWGKRSDKLLHNTSHFTPHTSNQTSKVSHFTAHTSHLTPGTWLVLKVSKKRKLFVLNGWLIPAVEIDQMFLLFFEMQLSQ